MNANVDGTVERQGSDGWIVSRVLWVKQDTVWKVRECMPQTGEKLSRCSYYGCLGLLRLGTRMLDRGGDIRKQIYYFFYSRYRKSKSAVQSSPLLWHLLRFLLWCVWYSWMDLILFWCWLPPHFWRKIACAHIYIFVCIVSCLES